MTEQQKKSIKIRSKKQKISGEGLHMIKNKRKKQFFFYND